MNTLLKTFKSVKPQRYQGFLSTKYFSQEFVQRFPELEKQAYLGGGVKRIDKQHQSHKLTARERLELLFDPGTFVEYGKFVTHDCHNFGMDKDFTLGDGVVTGHGQVNGRLTFAYSQDFTVYGGSLSRTQATKICKVLEKAVQAKGPVVGLNDSGGARIQEGVLSLSGYADIFQRNVDTSGVVPQLTLIMGPCAGGAVYSPALTDFVFMVEESSYMFITGPDVVKTVTNEVVTKEELGGAKIHCETSGVAQNSYPNDIQAIAATRELLSYLPQSWDQPRPVKPWTEEDRAAQGSTKLLNNIIPADPHQAYDMKQVIRIISDRNQFFEFMPNYAPNVITGFGEVEGHSVGYVANQPAVLAGCIDLKASQKAAKFIRFCDAFNIPLVFLADVPGFLPGVDQEYEGVIRHGAKWMFATKEATVPKISFVLRKLYGGAYGVMNAKELGGDFNYAWPSAEIAVMGSAGAVKIIGRDMDKDKAIEMYEREYQNPLVASRNGIIDDIIQPERTRELIADNLRALANSEKVVPNKTHDNCPL